MILHICKPEKFIFSFYEFVRLNFKNFETKHIFYVNGICPTYRTPEGKNVIQSASMNLVSRYIFLIKAIYRAEKIILHGMSDMYVLTLISVQPWMLKKCYWVIWGGDLYSYKLGKKGWRWWRNEIFRRFAIKRIGHFVTLMKGEYGLAKAWYGASGRHHECFTYPSNLFKGEEVTSSSGLRVNILLGNSADPSNNHEEILELLRDFMHMPIKVYCPLSYGSTQHAKYIEKKGKEFLGDKFVPLLSFMMQDEYMNFLKKIDIAIFAHNRQQAMGNTIALLGMGKKVFMRSDTTQWRFLNDIGIKIYDYMELNIGLLETNIAQSNSKIISEYFSEKNLVQQLSQIFEAE